MKKKYVRIAFSLNWSVAVMSVVVAYQSRFWEQPDFEPLLTCLYFLLATLWAYFVMWRFRKRRLLTPS